MMLLKKFQLRQTRLLKAMFLAIVLPYASWSTPGEKEYFYNRKAEGWFWYNELLEPEDKKISPISSKQGKKVPAALSVAWLRENLRRYRELAIDDPTPNNVAAYFALQRLAMDKAQKFAETFRMLPALYPQLDENIRRPTATFAAHVTDRVANAERNKVLKTIAQNIGIFFFFKSDCPYCHAQAPVLALMERKYGFKIIPISTDGLPMPGTLYQDYRVDQGQARKLGITITPTLFLVNPKDPGSRLRLLSQGAISLGDMETRIVNVAYNAGWINTEDYQKTLNFNPIYLSEDIELGMNSQPEPNEILRILGVNRSPNWME